MNPYEEQIRAQGREPSGHTVDLGEFPQTRHGRYYETKDICRAPAKPKKNTSKISGTF